MRSRSLRVRLAIMLAGLGVGFLASSPQIAAQGGGGQIVPRPALDVFGLVWVKTGGPLGGMGYDIRARPDDPNVMLVTDTSGGVHRSVDGGLTWVASNTGIDVRTGDGYPLFCVTIDPRNPDIAWAGTQARMGIFKSTDGGQTWQRKSNGVTGDMGVTFRGFTVDPNNSDIVYAAGEISSTIWNNGVYTTYNGGERVKGMVYKTTDGGEHWTQIWYGDNLARYVWIDPRNTNVLYVSTGIFDRAAANSNDVTREAGGVGILKSTDGGQTWRVLNQANGLGNLYVGSLFMHPTNPDILLAGTGGGASTTGGGVYLTTNGGLTWWRTLSEQEQPFGAVEISLTSPQVCYAVAGAVYRSDDGCVTWKRYFFAYNTPGDPSAGMYWGVTGIRGGFPIDLEADRRDPMRVFINSYGGGNFLSTDGGKTWANASRGYTGAVMRSVAVDPSNSAVVYSVARSGVFKSSNGGTDWDGANTASLPSELSTVVVSPANPREVLLSDATNGRMWKSVDGAQTWVPVLNYNAGISAMPFAKYNDRAQGFTSIAYAPSDARIVYAGLSYLNCNMLAGTGGMPCEFQTYLGVHRSTDGGSTWLATASGGLGLQSILALTVHPRNPDVVYAATGGSGVYKTENGGVTWVPINQGLTRLNIRSIAIDATSPQTVYAGTCGGGIFKSTDGGATWRATSAGLLPNADIRTVLISPTNSSVLWIGDQCSGTYCSLDAGATWVKVNAGLDASAIAGMAMSADGSTVYAGVLAGGVYRLDVRNAAAARPHPSDSNGDFRLAISEVTGYGAAWKRGDAWPVEPNPIPIAYVTRAGYLWRLGETYQQDATAGACPACWVARAVLPVPAELFPFEALPPLDEQVPATLPRRGDPGRQSRD